MPESNGVKGHNQVNQLANRGTLLLAARLGFTGAYASDPSRSRCYSLLEQHL